MKEEYNRLFEKVAPRMSDDELFKAVLNSGKGHNMENNSNTSPKKRRIAPMIAAVAATAALTTTAGAVTGYYRGVNDSYKRNVNEDYNNVLVNDAETFPQEYTDKDGNVIDQKDAALESGMYEKMNIEINKTFRGEGFTFEVPGAISDGEEVLIMYNVIFDEDPWAGKDAWVRVNDHIYIDSDTVVSEIVANTRLGEGTVSERDGKKVYSSYFNLRGLDQAVNKRTLRVWLNNLCSSQGWTQSGQRVYPRYIRGYIDIPLTDELTKFNKTVDIPDEPYVELGSAGNWDLVQLEVTPLGVSFSLKTDEEVQDTEEASSSLRRAPMYVNFKDGSSLDVMSGYDGHATDEENKTLFMKSSFNYPIDVDEVQSVQFANALVNMEDGSVTTVDAPKVPFYYYVEEDHTWYPIEE